MTNGSAPFASRARHFELAQIVYCGCDPNRDFFNGSLTSKMRLVTIIEAAFLEVLLILFRTGCRDADAAGEAVQDIFVCILS